MLRFKKRCKVEFAYLVSDSVTQVIGLNTLNMNFPKIKGKNINQNSTRRNIETKVIESRL
jgi:hypothetical protein